MKECPINQSINQSINQLIYLFFAVSHSTQEVMIRDGLTSDGEVLDTVYANNYEYDPFFSKTGFYIRFRGLIRPMDNLQIVFTSFREQGFSGL